MAETKRMTAEQVVSYLLEEDGLDYLRESLLWVVQQLMEVEVSASKRSFPDLVPRGAATDEVAPGFPGGAGEREWGEVAGR